MPIGPGKYDDELSFILDLIKAREGALIVIDGNEKGAGFAVQATLETTLALPNILREMANQLDVDIMRMREKGELPC